MGFVKVGLAAVGLAKNGVALYDVISYKGSYNSIPFLSPVLWLDMALVSDLLYSNENTQPLSFLAAGTGFGMFIVCFWLLIGYCFLGYGTTQYEALDIPQYCQTLGISWQTDPRRRNFVRMQVIIFLSATLGFFVAIVSYFKVKASRENWNVPTLGEAAARNFRLERENASQGFIQRAAKRFGEWKKRHFGAGKIEGQQPMPENNPGPISFPILPAFGRFKGRRLDIPKIQKPKLELSEHLNTIVMMFVLFPFLAGVGLAAALNWNSYLLLGQKGCYASYVSGRWGYLDLELINFRIKLATWLGLNT